MSKDIKHGSINDSNFANLVEDKPVVKVPFPAGIDLAELISQECYYRMLTSAEQDELKKSGELETVTAGDLIRTGNVLIHIDRETPSADLPDCDDQECDWKPLTMDIFDGWAATVEEPVIDNQLQGHDDKVDVKDECSSNHEEGIQPSNVVLFTPKSRGFHYIPAGMVPLKLANAHVYTKEITQGDEVETINSHAQAVNGFSAKEDRSKSAKHFVTVKITSTHAVWIEHAKKQIGPPNKESWQYITADLFRKECHVSKDFAFEVMGSYHYVDKELQVFSDDDPFIFDNEQLNYILDSAGFQLMKRVVDYVDPAKVAKVCAKFAHRGVAVDIPPVGDDYYDEDIMELLAMAQKRNMDIMKQHLPAGYDLVIPVHGADLEAQIAWFDTVYDPDFQSYAVSVGKKEFDLNRLPMIAKLMFDHSAHSIHLLGSSSQQLIPLYCVIGKYRHVTADSSSWMYKSMRHRKYLVYQNNGTMREFDIGRSSNVYPDGSGVVTKCNCPVCKAIPCLEVYGTEEQFKTTAFLALHNMYVYKQVVDYWNQLVQSSPIEEVARHYADCFRWKNREKAAKKMVFIDRFMAMAKNEGAEAAIEHYDFKFSDPDGVDDFDEEEVEDDDSFSAEELFLDAPEDSSIFLLDKYLPEDVLSEYGYTPEFFQMRRKTVEIQKEDKRAVFFEKYGLLLHILLENNSTLLNKFGDDLNAFSKFLSKVLHSESRRCAVNPDHKLEVVTRDEWVIIICPKCEYELCFEFDDDEKQKKFLI